MPPTNDQKQYLLTDDQNDLLFSDIWLDTEIDSAPVANPTVLFLGGQPGSGKSSLAQYHLKQFADRGGVVLVNSDALWEYHPAFANLQRTDADRASFLVNPDTVIWQQKLISAAVADKRNLLLDGTLGGSSAPILAIMERLHSEGYTIRVSVLAVPAEQSRLGIYKRYEDQLALKGSGRWVGMETHDRVFDEIPQNLALLQGQSFVNQIQLYARPKGSAPPALLYDNFRLADQSDWKAEPLVIETLRKYRNQLPSDLERVDHEGATQDVQHQMEVRGASQAAIHAFLNAVRLPNFCARPATAADVQLYFDWANDPVTRQQSFNSAPITWEKHEAWFAQKLTDSDVTLLVFETSENAPVGQVRFEKQPDGEIIIGVSLDAFFRGKGLASTLIQAAVRACQAHWNSGAITACIKPDNVASVQAFERAGFVKQHSGQPDRLRLVKR